MVIDLKGEALSSGNCLGSESSQVWLGSLGLSRGDNVNQLGATRVEKRDEVVAWQPGQIELSRRNLQPHGAGVFIAKSPGGSGEDRIGVLLQVGFHDREGSGA